MRHDEPQLPVLYLSNDFLHDIWRISVLDRELHENIDFITFQMTMATVFLAQYIELNKLEFTRSNILHLNIILCNMLYQEDLTCHFKRIHNNKKQWWNQNRHYEYVFCNFAGLIFTWHFMTGEAVNMKSGTFGILWNWGKGFLHD